MDDLLLKAVFPVSIYDMDGDTNLLYRFTGKRMYMMNPAEVVHRHKFAEAIAECYIIPDKPE